MRILVTGGAGYIGSHTIIELHRAGFIQIVSVDNYINSSVENYDLIADVIGKKIAFYVLDLSDRQATIDFFSQHQFDAVIHFAALKSVPESVENPTAYYRNNLNSLVNLLDCCKKHQINHFIFSSSCSVYGNPETLPVTEKEPFGIAESPYAHTKQIGEGIIKSFCEANSNFKSISLRYFNPAGADQSGKIGEKLTGRPGNLVPVITQTAAGIRTEMTVFGDDYATRDGSCIRDYIHVSDIAIAHVKALSLFSEMQANYEVINLGSGKGTTVMELLKAFEKVSGQSLNYQIGPPRAGDVEAVYANNQKAKKLLDWETKKTVEDILSTAWEWQLKSRV